MFKIRAITFAVAFSMTLFLAMTLLAQNDIPSTTLKDMQQDEHLKSVDNRVNELEAANRAAQLAREIKSDKRDAQILELHDKVNQLYAWGTAAFATITFLQSWGLLKQYREKKP